MFVHAIVVFDFLPSGVIKINIIGYLARILLEINSEK